MEIQFIRTSMLFIEWEGFVILTDPWFGMSMRGLPVFVKPSIKPEELPALDLILVSHFHPDHFDRRALLKLRQPCKLLVGPKGIKERSKGVMCERIVEMKDEQILSEQDFTIYAFSVLHSGHELAYVIERGKTSLVFAGDSRYDATFKRIGERLIPQVALLPVGGTLILGRRIVMSPRDALCAAYDLGCKVVIPIHVGGEWMSVPPLSLHPGRAKELVELAKANQAPFSVVALEHGERVRICADGKI